MSQPTILVTGGAGYIGSHAVLALQQAGYGVVVLDNLAYGHQDIANDVLKVELVVGDTCDRPLLDNLFATRDIAAVMHFAAYTYVGESVTDPAKYYRNNFVGTLTLLRSTSLSFLPLVQPTACLKLFPFQKITPKIRLAPTGSAN